MKNKIFVLALLGITALTLVSSQSFAWGRRDRHHKKEFIHRLDLNNQQKERFMIQKQEVEEKKLAYRQKSERIRIEMKEELAKDHPNRDKLHRYIRKINQHRTDMQLRRIDYMLEMRMHLSPEQRVRFKEMCRQGFGIRHKRK
ncbi:MAG: periplasmic heavy metal sensor [Candidatus Saganbacteria bacterium]|nr:periplasmic heavy metal sensor [Candidatus Saganbacteria bacterium]